MKRMIKFLTLCIILISGSAVHSMAAQKGDIYLQAEYFRGIYSSDYLNKDVDINAGSLSVGVYICPYLSGQILAGTSIGSSSVYGVDVSLDYILGAYFVGEYPVNKYVKPFAKIGVSYAKANIPAWTGFDDTASDVSYGAAGMCGAQHSAPDCQAIYYLRGITSAGGAIINDLLGHTNIARTHGGHTLSI